MATFYFLLFIVIYEKEEQLSLFFFVGIPGFEPGTPCSQSRCANRTALHPDGLMRFVSQLRCKGTTYF